jgi:hypothetical protein
VTVVNEHKIKIDQYITFLCYSLLKAVSGYQKAGNKCTIEEADGLLKEIDRLGRIIQGAKHRAEHFPKIGESVRVVRYHHGFAEVGGTIIGGDADEVEVQVAPGFTITAGWDTAHERWIDWSHPDKPCDLCGEMVNRSDESCWECDCGSVFCNYECERQHECKWSDD